MLETRLEQQRLQIGTGLQALLDMTSEDQYFDMPMPYDWLVDWSMFFTDSTADPKVNLSRRIGPKLARAFRLVGPEGEQPLLEKDLIRSMNSGLRSVESLIDELPRAITGDYQ